MLAKEFDPKRVAKFQGIYLQPKLDGCRAIWDGNKLWTRTGKPVLALPALVEELRGSFGDFPLDGEIYREGLSFEDIVGGFKRNVNIDEDMSLQYWVYDYPVGKIPFIERSNIIGAKIKDLGSARIKLVDTSVWSAPINSAQMNIFSTNGFEGTMARNGVSFYEGKRTSNLLKIKDFMDSEFLCVGTTQLKSYEKIVFSEDGPGRKPYADGTFYKNGQETLIDSMGSLILRDEADNLFECGSGFSDAQRLEYWENPPIDKMITVKYQNLTELGVPRFPIFKAVKDIET